MQSWSGACVRAPRRCLGKGRSSARLGRAWRRSRCFRPSHDWVGVFSGHAYPKADVPDDALSPIPNCASISWEEVRPEPCPLQKYELGNIISTWCQLCPGHMVALCASSTSRCCCYMRAITLWWEAVLCAQPRCVGGGGGGGGGGLCPMQEGPPKRKTSKMKGCVIPREHIGCIIAMLLHTS